MRQEVLIGIERRRRWSDTQKLLIVKEVDLDGATVADVARRHDVTRQHIYQWRVELRRKHLLADETGVAFFPVESHAQDSSTVPAPQGGSVEILLSNGRRICCIEGLAEADLVHLIRVVERA
jgi:transposase